MSDHAADRLLGAMRSAGAPACVGLDPVVEKLPASLRAGATTTAGAARAIELFCIGVLRAVAPTVSVVKPQSACFERYGHEGFAALEAVCAEAQRLGLFVILDAKRGDVPHTAAHYAAWAFDRLGADAMTVNAYLGPDSLEPYLRHAPNRMVFALVRTSNEGSDAFQSLASGTDTVADEMARLIARAGSGTEGETGYSCVGAVVGATKPSDAARMRSLMKRQPLLVPGFGAQGGSAATVRELFDADRSGAVVTASRSVIYAFGEKSAEWESAVADAARKFVGELKTVV